MKKTVFIFLAAILLLPLAGGQIIFRCGFDSGEDFARWKAIPGWSYSANGGRNGTGAAVLTRNKFTGPLTSLKLDSLKPGVLYRLTVWVKPEKLESDGKNRNYGAFCIEFVKDGKWMSGYYPLAANTAGKWQKCTLEFMLKPKAEQTSIVLYMRKGFRGTLYFDDVTLEEAGDPKAAILVTNPSQLTFFGNSGDLIISGCSSDNAPKTLSVKISGDGVDLQTVLSESSPGIFKLPLTGLKPGKLDVQMVLTGKKDNKVIAKSQCALFVRADGRQKSSFDSFGNLYIDGKKFMPIGIFGGFPGVEDLKRISDAGFNTIMNYSSFGMEFGGRGNSRLESITKSLDVIQQHNLKLLFSLKDQYCGMRYAVTAIDQVTGVDEVVKYAVSNLKKHPALLGWYMSDEHSRSEMPAMLALRELVNGIDPDHPAVTLTFREGDLPLYGTGADVLAVDYYPIISDTEKELSAMLKLLKSARLGRQPVWMVPQIFNPGVFKAKTAEEFSKYAYPGENEIKAMLASAVIFGSKGFIFYSYPDICGSRGKRFFPENEAKQWANVTAAVAMLKKIEPFIMSERVPEIIVDNGKELAAKLFDDKGNSIMIAVRADFGESKLALPCNKDYTLLDGSAELAGDKWIFTGKDIDFCILARKNTH